MSRSGAVRGRGGLRVPRRLVFTLILVVAVTVAIETASWVYLWWSEGTPRSCAAVAARQRGILAATQTGATGAPEPQSERPTSVNTRKKAFTVVHPYVGYVVDPAAPLPPDAWGVATSITTDVHGFPVYGTSEPAAGVRVAVIGGSVAQRLVAHAGPDLERALEESPAFAGKTVAVENLSMGGFKQPQQLATLAFMIALGRDLDVVINLDGFNELLLGELNRREGVFPHYPQQWWWQVGGLPDLDSQLIAARVLDLRGRRAGLARTFARAPLCWSRTGCLLWVLLDDAARGRIQRTESDLRSLQSREGRRGFLESGPAVALPDPERWPEVAAGVWQRSSEEMHGLCRQFGIRYYHFLQPNQYVPGSKPMGRAERTRALEEGSKTAELVRSGYPRLVEAGRELSDRGVRFHDLRMVFSTVEDPLYVDSCCHLSPRGSKLLAAQMAEVIASDFGP